MSWIRKYEWKDKIVHKSWWERKIRYLKSNKKRRASAENRRAYDCARKQVREDLDNIGHLILRTRIDNPDFPTISHYCDWSITQYGFAGSIENQPKTIYIQADPKFFLRFYKNIYPRIETKTRFTLITGSSDRTVPRQLDHRYQSYSGTPVEKVMNAILSDPRIVHWYTDNCDVEDSRITPIPLGYRAAWTGNKLYRDIIYNEEAICLEKRKLKAFCAHRHREGSQWKKRKKVTALATGPWSHAVDYYDSVHPTLFFDKLKEYAFTICVCGGGLDASPKAWTALLAGSIPIIECNPTTKAYCDLPVVFVDSWDEYSISDEKLSNWLKDLRMYYEDPLLRKEVLYKLSMGYWWEKICSTIAKN